MTAAKERVAKPGKAGRGMTAAKEKVMPNCGKAGRGMTAAKERVMPNQEKQVVA